MKRFLSMRIRGYSVRRWFLTILALSIILTHAIGSPFWYRIAADTRITQTEIVPSSAIHVRTGSLALNDYDDEDVNHIQIRRLIQRAIDAEHAGESRAAARGAIRLPVPTVFLELPELQLNDQDRPGHRFRCDHRREECSVMVQSSAYFVHILEAPNFITRLLIDRPLLAIREKDQGVLLTGLRFPRPEIWRDGFARVTEGFPPATTRLAITGGPVLDQNVFSPTSLNPFSFYKGTVLTVPPFMAFDMNYTLDFREPETTFLASCRQLYGLDENAATSELANIDLCSFDVDEAPIFTLTECDVTSGSCPGHGTNPADDLKTHDFVKSGATENISLGFLDDRSRVLFEIANRFKGSDFGTGLVNLPDRIEIVREIVIDYLTIAGFSAQSAEFERFLAANPDLDIDTLQATFQNVPDPLISQAMSIALERQPQLWVWHGYAEYIGPELLDGLAQDLVKIGLARPY